MTPAERIAEADRMGRLSPLFLRARRASACGLCASPIDAGAEFAIVRDRELGEIGHAHADCLVDLVLATRRAGA